MAAGRGIFQTVIARPRSVTINNVTFNVLEPLESVEIDVYVGGSYGTGGQQRVTIYQDDTTNAIGPVPGISASGTGPFTTGTTGAVEFWVPAGRYDIRIRDLSGGNRIAERILKRIPI